MESWDSCKGKRKCKPKNKRPLVGTGKTETWACSRGGGNVRRFLTDGFWSQISRAMAMSRERHQWHSEDKREHKK